MDQNNPPAFVRAPLPVIAQSVFTGLIQDDAGDWHNEGAFWPANANTPALQMAYVADSLTDGGRNQRFRVLQLVLVPTGDVVAEDVTAEAISCLCHALADQQRGNGADLRFDTSLSCLPDWWEDHVPEFFAEDDTEELECNPTILQRELGTY